MKKTAWIALLLALCIALLSACRAASAQPSTSGSEDSTQESSEHYLESTTDGNENDLTSGETTECQHTFGEWVTTEQATCVKEGQRTRTCSKCSVTENETVAKNDAHTPVTDAAVPATCKDTGLTEGSHCSLCGKVLVEQTIVPTTNNHTPVTDAAIPATCKNTGLSEGSHCSVCNYTLKNQTVIPKIDHVYTNNVCTMCNQSLTPSFVPDYSAGQANTIGSDVGNSRYASQADWIYFSTAPAQIYKVQKNSSTVISVYKLSGGSIRNVNVVGDWIYFYVEGSNTSSSYIAKVRTDGSSFEKILSSVTVGEMLVVKDTIFFTTIKSPYSNYAKDSAPLYSVSVNGGITKQLHDGYVSSITADATYVYFLQTLESGSSTIYRIKHDGTKEAELFTNADINYFVLAKSKLYFLKFDKYSDVYTVASISVNGGSYTTYGKIPLYSGWMYVVGNNIYYHGTPYIENGLSERHGVIALSTSTKEYTVVKEYHEIFDCYFTAGLLIMENHQNYGLESLSLYDPQTKAWRQMSIK